MRDDEIAHRLGGRIVERIDLVGNEKGRSLAAARLTEPDGQRRLFK